MRTALVIALLTSGSLIPSLAHAQTDTTAVPTSVPAADTAAATATAQEGGLADIVVTARRREENLQDVPLSVTAFTPETIQNARITDRTALANFTPSLITITGGYPQEFAFFALRGQGPAFGSTPGVLNYFAEVTNPISIDGRTGTYYDLANVQVLAGPQGTLFGKNATGGNILFEPQRPTNNLGGYFQAEVGNYSDRRFEGALNIPIIDDTVLFRVAGEIGRRDGYTTDVGPNFAGRDYDNLSYESVRASLTIRPAPGVELYTVGRYYASRTNGPGTVLTQFNPAFGVDLGPPFGFLPAVAFYPGLATAVADQQARGPRRVAYDLDEFSRTSYFQFINHATFQLSNNLTIKNIVSYSQLIFRYAYDYDATTASLGGQTSRTGNPTQAPNFFTEELQLQGRAFDNALNFTVGGYYDRQTLSSPQGGQFIQFPISLILGPVTGILNNNNRSYAVFGQGTFDLGRLGLDGVSLTGGLRHTWEDTESDTTLVGISSAGGSAHFQYTSYNATLDYRFNRNVHAYITSRDAYKAGGVNGPVPAGSAFRTFPPERLQDVEVGLKSQFDLGGVQGRLDIAAYRGTYTNIQRTTQEAVGGALLNVTRSAARGRIQGLEITAALVPFRGLTLSGSYSLTDSRYTRVADASAAAILAGSAFPYTPHDKVTLGAAYETPLGSIGTLALSTSYAYQSRFSTAQTNSAQVAYLPHYDTLSLRAGLRDVGGRPLDLTFFMANVTDNTHATGLMDQYATSGFVTYTYNEPRTYGVQLRYRFGS